ncbi:MAG: hypothetical protein ACREQI_11825 [Candidatus Binataceae bacterium]
MRHPIVRVLFLPILLSALCLLGATGVAEAQTATMTPTQTATMTETGTPTATATATATASPTATPTALASPAGYSRDLPIARRYSMTAAAPEAGAQAELILPAAPGAVTRLWDYTISCTPATGVVAGQATIVSDGILLRAPELVETTAGAMVSQPLPPIDAPAAGAGIVISVPAITSGGECVIDATYSIQN